MNKLKSKVEIPILFSETPDSWVVVKIVDEVYSPTKPEYKVFATWAGGYVGSESWRLNSGITKVLEDKQYLYFFGYSGSCYKCHKNHYGFKTAYGKRVLEGMINAVTNNPLSKTTMEILSVNTDWLNLILNDNTTPSND